MENTKLKLAHSPHSMFIYFIALSILILSIKTMCEMLSDVIESEKPLLPQVILTDEKFEVDLSYKMFEPPVTPPPDEPIEIPTPNIFTIAQV